MYKRVNVYARTVVIDGRDEKNEKSDWKVATASDVS